MLCCPMRQRPSGSPGKSNCARLAASGAPTIACTMNSNMSSKPKENDGIIKFTVVAGTIKAQELALAATGLGPGPVTEVLAKLGD